MPANPKDHGAEPWADDSSSLRATTQHLEFVAAAAARAESIDIRFDGHRIWSTDLTCAAGEVVRLEWPVNLQRLLFGSTFISVSLAATGRPVASGPACFSDDTEQTQIVDARGRWLAVNKWGNLGVPLESQKKGARRRLLRRAHRVIADLQELGFRPFLSSGSLLGAIRTGFFLPHDDDIDIGNVTDAQHPAALVIGSQRLERALHARGYIVVRHSHAHLQLVFLRKSGDLDHYIDVFTAYFDPDGTFNQPFSIRGKLSRAELEPFSIVELEGETYPAPAVPEKWLELNYGASWRVPDPGHQFDIDEQIRRRFDSWFGSFNLHRDYWEAMHRENSTVRRDQSVEFDYIASSLSSVRQGGDVIDIGCGISSTAFGLRQLGHRVGVADFSLPAIQAQSTRLASDAPHFLNLNDRHSVLEFALSRAQGGRATNLVFEHVLEGLGGDGKQNAFLLMHWLLHGHAVAVATIDTDLPGDHSFDDPTSWHFSVEDFVKLANSYGLTVRAVRRGTRRDDRGRTRQTAQAQVALGEGEQP